MPLTCPRCPDVALSQTSLGCLCSCCEGCWFGFEQFEKVLRLSEVELLDSELKPTLKADTEGVPLETQVDCPHCQVAMKRHLYLADSDITIDLCRSHGMWLDDGELAKIRAFLEESDSPQSTEQTPKGLFAFFRRVLRGSAS